MANTSTQHTEVGYNTGPVGCVIITESDYSYGDMPHYDGVVTDGPYGGPPEEPKPQAHPDRYEVTDKAA